jgi:hypothetical protein
MMLARLFAAAVLVALCCASASAASLAPPRAQLEQKPHIELVRYHRHRHHHRGVAAEDADDSNFDALFWPLSDSACMFNGCGESEYGYGWDCFFYSCGYGWELGPFAWGLFGLGLYDPFDNYGWGYGDYGGYAGHSREPTARGAGNGLGARHMAAGRSGRRHWGRRRSGGRHYGHHRSRHHFGGSHFGGHRFGGFHHGFGGFRHGGGGFHGGGFHGGGHGRR